MDEKKNHLSGASEKLTKMKEPRVIVSIIAVIVVLAAVIIPASMHVGAGNAEEGPFFGTIWALVPAFVAIVLALITKEVYSSLFIGIVVGALLYSDFSFEGTITHVFNDGMVGSLADSWNVGILVFLVILGAIVVLMNKAGGSAAFGKWAATHIHSKVGAQIATIILGILIFVDDYFNCLTVGSVMRPVTDRQSISRAKLAYLIDATAAPVCIIAPVSSWAAAVSSYVPDGQGFTAFVSAIPFNFYAILTIITMFFMASAKFEYGPMKRFTDAADKGDIFNGANPYVNAKDDGDGKNGKVIDLVFPIVVLIVCCVIGLMYTGGLFEGEGIIDSFSNSDASVGLMLGGAVALVIIIVYYILRGLMNFKSCMEALPEGFKQMVPAILILTFAWTLKAMTDSLGSTPFVEAIMKNAGAFEKFLPAIVFLIACVISFATGTSWGTFGILIPITLAAFPMSHALGVPCMSAAMAGAICGDHCSPISDTTIMASAGAQCDHVNHVSTQLPYALTVAAVSFVSYIVAGFFPSVYIALPASIVLMVGTLFVLKFTAGKKKAA